MASFLERNNTMDKILGFTFAGLVALLGGYAVYTTFQKEGIKPVGAQPINPAVTISVEEVELKTKRIEELSAEVEKVTKLYSAAKAEKEKAEETLVKKNQETIDLKGRIAGLDKDLQSSRLACTLQRAENEKLIEVFKELKKLFESEAAKNK